MSPIPPVPLDDRCDTTPDTHPDAELLAAVEYLRKAGIFEEPKRPFVGFYEELVQE